MKNNNLIQMLIHPFDFLNSKDLDTLPSVKSSHRLRRDKMMHSFTLRQNKRTTVFVKHWISLKMAFYPNISNPFFSYSRKTVFSWQCLSHRPTMSPCFEGPTVTCVQKATQQWLCWKLYHMGEAAGQHAQLKFVIKCSVFSLSEESSVKSVYVIFNLKINPLIQRSHWHEWRLVEVCLLQRKKGEIQKKRISQYLRKGLTRMIYSNIKVNRPILLADLGSDSEEIYIHIIILLQHFMCYESR